MGFVVAQLSRQTSAKEVRRVGMATTTVQGRRSCIPYFMSLFA
jgi:hypothetical protein